MIATLENVKQLLNEGMSINRAWNSLQLKALIKDEKFPNGFPRAGWRLRLVGKEITQEQIDEFLSLKNRHIEEKMPLFA